jgi:hypothetical protein
MVVIVDLDDEAQAKLSNVKPLHHTLSLPVSGRDQQSEDAERPNPNYNKGFSAALSCYP